tara:strand:- start:226 stop:495 length:270 start_codon:yes stop_codon:yes gene_type:complete
MPTPIDAYRRALFQYQRKNFAAQDASAVPGIDMRNVGAAITAPDNGANAPLLAQSNEDEIRNNILAAGWTPMEQALLTPAVPPEYGAVV